MKTSPTAFFFVFLLALLPAMPSWAQPGVYHSESRAAIRKFEEGMDAYQRRDDVLAVQSMLEAIDKDEDFLEAHLLLAEIYVSKGSHEAAAAQYREVLRIQPSFSPEVHYFLGEALVKSGKYTEAEQSLVRFLSLPNRDKAFDTKAHSRLAQATFGAHALNHPVPFEPTNLGPKVNGPFRDYLPALTVDERTLVITVCVEGQDPRMYGGCQEDFFISHKDEDGQWGQVRTLGPPLNTPTENEGAQSLSADGNLLFYTSCTGAGASRNCDIMFSLFRGGQWTPPRNLGWPVNTSYWESQPSFSSDGRTLYFVSNRPDGMGQMDIWQTRLNDDGSWAEPRNLGPAINTTEGDMAPFIHPDNQTLYFSSQGHPGMGGFDLYLSRRDPQGQWQKPQNLGYPINTHLDESYLILDREGQLAYFASDRIEGGQGKLDIYSFPLHESARPQVVTYVEGLVFDATTNARLSARFELIDLSTGSTVVEASSDGAGQFVLSLPTERDYALNVSRAGYLFYSANFSLRDLPDPGKPFHLDIPLQPIRVGQKTILRNVFFDTDSYALKPESKAELDKLVDFLVKNPSLRIELSGHTDNIGTQQDNQVLSENRAKSVRAYLVEHGVAESRLTAVGYGFSQPITTNETVEGRAQNRRTEFKIIE